MSGIIVPNGSKVDKVGQSSTKQDSPTQEVNEVPDKEVQEIQDALRKNVKHEATKTTFESLTSEDKPCAKEFDNLSSMPSNDYVKSVLNQPSKEDKSVRRTVPYAIDKLKNALAWRKKFGNNILHDYPGVRDIIEQESYLVWYGWDAALHPILWVRPLKKDWSRKDIKLDVAYHVYMIELGLSLMPPGVTQFVVIADASHLGRKQVNTKWARSLLDMVLVGFPDRLAYLIASPVNVILRTIYKIIRPFLPANLKEKIYVCSNEQGKHILASKGVDVDKVWPTSPIIGKKNDMNDDQRVELEVIHSDADNPDKMEARMRKMLKEMMQKSP